MDEPRRRPPALWFVLGTLGILSVLNVLKWRAALDGRLSSIELFTMNDAVISALPMLIWLIVAIPWEELSIGPFSLRRRLLRRIEKQLSRENITDVEFVELDPEADEIRDPETKAVSVTVGDATKRYEDLLSLVGKGRSDEKIDWRHVDYVAFIDLQKKLIGTMGPGRFRRRLLDEPDRFLDALRRDRRGEFLKFGHAVYVKETATKSQILKMYAQHPLSWFPVVDDDRKLIGVVETDRLAVAVVADLAESLSDD